MTLGRIWLLEKIVEQLSELPVRKRLFPLGGKGGGHFGRNGHLIVLLDSRGRETLDSLSLFSKAGAFSSFVARYIFYLHV
jgi:hypothetical protein